MGQTKLLFVSYCSVRVQGTSHWSRVSLLSVSLFFFLLSLFHVCRYFTNVTCMNVCFSGTPLRDFKPLLLSFSKGSD